MTGWPRIGTRLATALVTLTLGVGAGLPCAGATSQKPAPSRPSSRPDAALYKTARSAEQALRASKTRIGRSVEWRKVAASYEKVVAQFPKSSYCDDALLAEGQLYEEMARRFQIARYRADAVASYSKLVSQYPSSRHAEAALYGAFGVTRAAGDRKGMDEAARDYIETCPDGAHLKEVKAALRKSAPAELAALPSPPPPGLAQVFDVRTWSGEASTRIAIDLERKVEIHAVRIANPDRLFVDLIGTRIHPNLQKRALAVGDGLLEQVRIAQNRPDVVRIVLDFKSVEGHSVFFLADPIRLVVDVKGRPGPQTARAEPQAEAGPSRAAAPGSTAAPRTTPVPLDWPEGVPPNEGFRPPAPPSESKTKESAGKPTTERPSSAAGAESQTKTPRRLPQHPLAGMASAPTSPVSPATEAAQVTEITLPPPSKSTRTSKSKATAPPPPPTSAPERSSPVAASAAGGAPAPVPTPTPLPSTPERNRTGSFSLARQLGLAARRIVVDAGHGGHDPGAIGPGGLQEKDVVVDVAKRVSRMLREELHADVLMTRETDVFLPLEERTAIANSRGADLFLSIHANSSRNPRARGIETYFLNFARSSHAEEVVARENAISEATLKDLQGLVKAITLNSKIDESRDFASSVQEAMVVRQRPETDVQDRGVHTAPFYVLIGANMPSILAEIAFISNPEDERLLRSPEHREMVAEGIFRGVTQYFESLNRVPGRPVASARSVAPTPKASSKSAPPVRTSAANRTSITRRQRR